LNISRLGKGKNANNMAGYELQTDILSSIVFSFWKTTLNLVAELFDKHGIQHCRIHGSMSLTERRKVLGEFKTSGTTSILLMTLGTGAVG
jgi:SWI/SNF-related matrix-associated actin-dependent regulator of chromatin subfamily A3